MSGRPQEFERVRISRTGGNGGGVGGALPSGAQKATSGRRRSWRLIIESALVPSGVAPPMTEPFHAEV
eukprot:120027-Prymnesium_polylepis.1